MKRIQHIIYVENEQEETALFRGYKSALRRAVTLALQYEAFPYKAEISIALIEREKIREVNRTYRNKDSETDVLSFPMTEDFDNVPGGDLDKSAVLLGDILICPAVIEGQAKDFGQSFEDELALMSIHSTLHLLGYDHMTPDEEKEMFRRQEEILEKYKKTAKIKEKNQ